MHQDRCVELAREAAVACGERHSYMPATWVIDAMLLAADEAERERDQYRAGNTELLEALMRYAEGQESAPAFAQDVLGRAGMLNGADGTLNWQALEDRKPKPITWEQAVNECVTDPEERARLLALARAKAAAEAAKPEVEREAALRRRSMR